METEHSLPTFNFHLSTFNLQHSTENMAQPIPLELSPRDPRAELQARLQNTPVEHAEALLSAYEVLQGLHDCGVFEMLRGALGSSDKIVTELVQAANTPGAVRGIRNLIILAKTLGTIEPELVEGFVRSLPEALARTRAYDAEPPGLWEIMKQFRDRNLRRGLLLVNSMLEAFGRNLPAAKEQNLTPRDQKADSR